VRPIGIVMLVFALCGGWALAQPPEAPRPGYSADGLYNLANAYARAGKPGLAILNYERAALLAPGDADIRMNLGYVRAAAHLRADPPGPFARIVLASPPALSAWIGVLGVALIGSGLLAARAISRRRWLPALSMAAGIALVVLTLSQAIMMWPRLHAAVVLVNRTPARVSPVPMSDTAFELPEGETVALTATHEDFSLIRTHDGLSGWVARASLGTVVP
jgi:hypothetical protein